MMESNLQHEDLLIKLRAKLNEEKIKLWEAPFLLPDDTISQTLKDLACKYAEELSYEQETVLGALRELQLHSVERSKANAEFKETGCATFRIRVTSPGERPRIITVQRKLDVAGSELIKAVAEAVEVEESRIKVIFNGKVIKPASTLEEQGIKNGVQMMALVLTESPEEAQREDTMYMEMRQTRDDATLLSECVDELEDDEYMDIEDQSGNTVQLPPAEKRALLVGLALHERGREHLRRQEYALALVLLLEADRLFSECRSSLLQSVDNYGVVQVDVAWCYLCLRALPAGAGDAARRLAAAQAALRRSYGPRGERLRALRGAAANERVLLMRLSLLRGVVAYHQNQRQEARALLDQAERELNALRVEPSSVTALMELGWSAAAARAGLRAAAGDVARAHHYLEERRDRRRRARDQQRDERARRLLGVCAGGAALDAGRLATLAAMGYGRGAAARALRAADNRVPEAVRLLQDQPDLLAGDSSLSSEEEGDSASSDDVQPDQKLVAELEQMDARPGQQARGGPQLGAALDLLAGGGPAGSDAGQGNPSTSSNATKKKHKKQKMEKKRHAKQQALRRLRSVIKGEEDDYLDTSLVEEELFLTQYKSLL